MSEAVTPDFDVRCPIWARYTNEPTDRKRDQIERVLRNAGARFGVHVGRVGIAVPTRDHTEPLPQRVADAPSVVFSDVDWIEDDSGIWIEAHTPAHNAERTVSELPWLWLHGWHRRSRVEFTSLVANCRTDAFAIEREGPGTSVVRLLDKLTRELLIAATAR